MDTKHLTPWEKIKLIPYCIMLWIGYGLLWMYEKIMGDE